MYLEVQLSVKKKWGMGGYSECFFGYLLHLQIDGTYRLLFRGGVKYYSSPYTSHLGGTRHHSIYLPHSVPIVVVWYLRFPFTASSQRLMCELLRLHLRHVMILHSNYVRDTHLATSFEELYQRPTILNSHHINTILYSGGFVKRNLCIIESFFPLCVSKNVYRMYSVKPSILNIPHSEGVVKSLS